MPIPSRWSTHVPNVSLPTWMFGDPLSSLPDYTAYIDVNQPDAHTLSYEDYRLWSKRIGLGLQNAGLRPGDRVLFFGGNHLLFPCIFMGVIMAGGVFTGANPAFTTQELTYLLQDSGPTFVIARPDVLVIATEAVGRLGLPKSRIYVFDGSDVNMPSSDSLGERHWSQLVADGNDAQSFQWVEPMDPASTTCCLNYSSGTSGLPKGVETTHINYVATGEAAMIHRDLLKSGDQTERALCFLPMYHAAAQTVYAIDYPKMGITTYMMPSFNFVQMLECIQRFGITELLVAPPIVQALCSPLARKYNLSSVKAIFSGTSPLSPKLALQVEQLWPNREVQIRQAWGMTELTGAGAVWDASSVPIPESVGEVVPNGTIKLMDGEREITEPNVPGEMWFSGPAMMKGYWQNPTATQETIIEEDGIRWLKTGDLAYVDSYSPGANIFLVDRIKELIKVKGFQVPPAELEAVLLQCPGVADAGVVGVQLEGTEVPRAYVVKAADSTITKQEITTWVEERLTEYKWLKGGVAFVNSIPRNPVSDVSLGLMMDQANINDFQAGKILRRILRDRAAEEIGVTALN
ncbi:hypothetical protein NM208_g197 [Fusarium decemcellulare]|uniref:Uncharacterized protein n=1 Tax=Fusarium decemcellulare TaxID=57161 RepID=A0ACC1T076_9HYPO|nr:hypothetical protein NM208_g197 [Fusarium decemcellulare]